jgi:solute:Na+ symporter, SSS family
MNAALVVIAAILVVAMVLGLGARFGREMSLSQWAVAARGLGSVFVFLLLAGEHFSAFLFLGGSGYAYGHGGPAYYAMSYTMLAFAMAYWLLPPIWRYAKEHRLISQPDFFRTKYDSPALGMLVATIGLLALIPYMILQFRGLGLVVSTASYGSISAETAIWVAAAIITGFVTVSGIRGSAWTSALKDGLVLLVAVFLGIFLPFHYYGGYTAMFTAIEQAKPAFLALPSHGENIVWFLSSIMVSLFGFYMWPQVFASIYTAKQERSLRLLSITIPLYLLLTVFVMFVGFSAILQIPGLTGAKVDLVLLQISMKTFDPWFVGVIGGAGALTALVPGSVMVGAAATLLANNFYRRLRPTALDSEIALAAKVAVPLIALFIVWMTLRSGQTLVSLLLLGYSFLTQLFPSLLMSLCTQNPVTREGAMAGIGVGAASVLIVTLAHLSLADIIPGLPDSFREINVGIVALILNIVTTAFISWLTRKSPRPRTRESF